MLDISMPLDGTTPTWPGSPGLATSAHMSIDAGDVANASLLTMDVHCGTHVDAPRHFVADGANLEAVGLDAFVGPAHVADATGVSALGAGALEALDVPPGTSRLLLKTDNSLDVELRTAPFRSDYVALTPDGAQWIVDRGIRLIGIDYLSIQRFHDPPDAHQILLGAPVVILEGLDLREAQPGPWTLMCLPLRLAGIDAEAAPARAVLIEEDGLG